MLINNRFTVCLLFFLLGWIFNHGHRWTNHIQLQLLQINASIATILAYNLTNLFNYDYIQAIHREKSQKENYQFRNTVTKSFLFQLKSLSVSKQKISKLCLVCASVFPAFFFLFFFFFNQGLLHCSWDMNSAYRHVNSDFKSEQ